MLTEVVYIVLQQAAFVFLALMGASPHSPRVGFLSSLTSVLLWLA